MGKKHLSAVISLKDNMSATMRDIRKEQKSIQREARRTKKEMQSAFKKEYKLRLDSTKAHEKIKKFKAEHKALRKKIVSVIVAKDKAKAKIAEIKGKLKAINKFVAKPAVWLKDKVGPKIKAIRSKLEALRVPITVAVTAVVAGIKGAAMQEQQNISVEHFMGVNNAGKTQAQIKNMSKSYTKALRQNANMTPFKTAEVMQAGTRSLQISKGNTKEAMKTLKLAEDMAALNPGKSISDAMEALADADMGEMERLKEFGFKASSTDDPKKVREELAKMYSGGSAKLATTGAGLFSTIVGQLQTGLTEMGTGILNSAMPALQGLVGFMGSAIPVFTQVGQSIGSGIGSAISFLSSQMPTLGPIFQNVFTSIGSILGNVMPVIGQAIKTVFPIFTGLLSIASAAFSGIAAIAQIVCPIVGGLIKKLEGPFRDAGKAVTDLGNTFTNIFNGIKRTVYNAYKNVKDTIGKLKNAVSSGLDTVSSIGGWRAFGGNATGTQYWTGGLSVVGEHGPELVSMPSGSKVYTNQQSKGIVQNMGVPMRSTSPSRGGNTIYITINKLAEVFKIDSDMDINYIVEQFVAMLKIALLNYAG